MQDVIVVNIYKRKQRIYNLCKINYCQNTYYEIFIDILIEYLLLTHIIQKLVYTNEEPFFETCIFKNVLNRPISCVNNNSTFGVHKLKREPLSSYSNPLKVFTLSLINKKTKPITTSRTKPKKNQALNAHSHNSFTQLNIHHIHIFDTYTKYHT